MDKLNNTEAEMNLPLSKLNVALIISSKGLRKKKSKADEEEIIKKLQCMGNLPDATNLDISLPAGVYFIPGLVIRDPEYGMVFLDAHKYHCFQRASQIPIAKTEHLAAIKFIGEGCGSEENYMKPIKEELKARLISNEEQKFFRVKQEVLE